MLVIMSDEHQSRAMGCADHPFVKTPNLDRLAARGMRFNNAYTPSPICVPARAAFATGRYPHQNRLWDNAMPYTGNIPGWGHALQKAGVPVESIGKLHYRDASDPAGFDTQHMPMQVVNGVGMVWGSIRREDQRINGPSRMLGEYIGPGESTYTKYDAAVTSKTIEWLGTQQHESPWCLYVGMVAPHFPLVVPQEFYDMYPHDMLPEVKQHPDTGYRQHPWIQKQDAPMHSEAKFKNAEERLTAMSCYYALCSWMDNNVGQIISALEDNNLIDSTTVVYTSDHGDNVGARGLWGKSNMYEESCAVPLIISGPDVSTGTCETPVSLLDLSVTITEHFNQAISADEVHGAPVGENLLDIANKPYDSERVVFSEYHAFGAVSGAFMIRKGRWKYNYYVGFEPELFDLHEDPEETVNVAQKHPDIVALLHVDLLAICDPNEVDALAHDDQDKMVESYGGREKALQLGAPGATPPPQAAG